MMAGLGDGAGVGSGGSGGQGAGDGGAGAGGASGGNSNTGGTGDSGGTGGSSNGAGAGGAAGSNSGNLGDAGKGAASWRDTLPDDLKADPTLSKYSDINNLAKAHIELQKKFGEKGIFKPKAGASPEEIKSFREAMGIPTTPDKYDMGTFEGVKVEQSIVDWAKKMGSEHGVEPAALKAIITDYMKIDASNQGITKAAGEKKMKDDLEGLKKEWGDGYDTNMKKANFTAEKMGGKDFIEALVEHGAHNDPRIIKAFVQGSKLYGEDTLREGGVGEGRATPAELDGKIAAVQSRLFSLKPTDGAYLGVKAEYENLWKQKTGGR